MRKISVLDVKRTNRLNTIRSILACDRISQREISSELDISWPTVLQNVKELMELGLVEKVGFFESTGGRKANAFAPIKDARLSLGMDITQNHVSLVLVNLAGEIQKFTRRKKRFALTEEYFLALEEMVDAFIAESGYEKEKFIGIGVSLPGIVDQNSGVLTVSHALNLRNVELKRFAEHLPFDATFLNDANAACLAEMRGRSYEGNTVYLSLSNSVGGAIYTDGELYMGANLRSGEFGHSTLVPNGRTCYCGKQGCLDSYCSAKRLAELADGNLGAFFDRLRCADSSAREAWEAYSDWLAIAVNNLRMNFDCDVILGGYVGAYAEEDLEEIRQKAIERSPFEEDGSYIMACRYKNEAAGLGAALVQIDLFLERLF